MRRSLLLLCSTLGLAGSAAGQIDPVPTVGATGPRPLATDLVVPIHTRDLPGYGTWAAGGNFKAGFAQPDRPGFEYVPYAGPSFAENQHWRWRTVAARCGEFELVDRADPAGRAVSGLRYEYDLGGVVEAYDLSAAGVEQTFTIAARPDGTGPLVVSGTVDTPLHCPPRAATHAPLHFTDPDGLLTVEYGAATAIDADGHRLPMTSAWDGTHLTLQLGADDVARARFPLVVDPVLIHWSNVETVGRLDVDSYELNTKWVAYTRVASSGDHDVYLQRYDDGWQNMSVRYADITSATSTDGIALAACDNFFLSEPNAYLAYEQRTATKTEIAIAWGAQSRVVHRVTAIANEHLRNPSLCGDGLFAGVCLAYDRVFLTSYTVRALVVDEAQTGFFRFTAFPAAIAVTTEEVHPQVVRGTLSDWNITWAENGASSTAIFAREVYYSGSVLDPRPFLSPATLERYRTGSHTIDQLRATTNEFTMIYSFVRSPRRLGTRALQIVAIDTYTAPNPVLYSRSLHSGLAYENGAIARDEEFGSIATACFTTLQGLTRQLRCVRLGADGNIATEQVNTSANLPRSPDLDFAARRQGSPSAAGEYVAVWATAASNNPIYGEELHYPAAAFLPLIVNGSVDCAQVDELAAFDQPSLAGNAEFDTFLQEAGPLDLLVVGLRTARLPLDALGMTGCQMGAEPVLYLPADGVTPVPLPTNTYGASLLFQWILVRPGANPLGVVTSDTVLVRIQ